MEDEEEMPFAAGDSAGPGLQSTPKIPPSFDGRSSWFAYEEAVDDWVDITTLEAEKLGPSLKTDLLATLPCTNHSLTATYLEIQSTGSGTSRTLCGHTS